MMRKKGFTLVEILIVIVIIGILIAALLPRMSAAQGRARDVARKNDLSQIQAALVAYNGDHGHYPITEDWVPISKDRRLVNALYEAGFSSIPRDPQEGSVIQGIGASNIFHGEYWYKSMDKNGVENGGFILAAHVEIPGSANYLLGNHSSLLGSVAPEDLEYYLLGFRGGLFKVYADNYKDKIDEDLKKQIQEYHDEATTLCEKEINGGCYNDIGVITYCESIDKAGKANGSCKDCGDQNEPQFDNTQCRYDDDSQLVYVLTY